ncbi:alpha/beta hydrolase [Paludisphaera mucosa]|uniref:Alpha/beta hydrolase n=1 Tax=Paludisphaera mucosa TaxID=3030827 RepID=A0ABT6F943_9BACT|nr:alpha/beta fold hydrolase [Paludisphaera mucosa]MDG3004096.1 alpha/beta hydrolase [Paludisphaera mucosa]
MRRRRFGPGPILVGMVALLGSSSFGQLSLAPPPRATLLRLTLTPNGSQDPPGDRLTASILLYPGIERVDLQVHAVAETPPAPPGTPPTPPNYLKARGEAFRGPEGRFRIASSSARPGGGGIVETSIVVPHAAIDVGPDVGSMRYTLMGRIGEDEVFFASTRWILPPGRRPATGPVVLDLPSPVAPGKTMPSPGGEAKTFPGAQAPAAPTRVVPHESPFVELHKRSVLFATNRRVRAEAGPPSARFGDELGATLRYGSCLVNIPLESHQRGRLELPGRFSRPDPALYFLIDATNMLDERGFRDIMRGGDTRGDALVYVHGFNTPFDFAVVRLAQIVQDLKFAGIPMVFSWPSLGSAWDYGQDQANAEWSVKDLTTVLKQVVDERASRPAASRGKVHVIAHSLGNRVTLRALAALDAQLPAGSSPFGEIVLAAPDVSVDEFTRLLPAARRRSERVSLYFNPNDNALLASEIRHPGEPRAGRAGLFLDGLDSIDASRADTSLLGHGYWAEVRPLLADLQILINLGWPPDRRVPTPLEAITGAHPYWAFPAETAFGP